MVISKTVTKSPSENRRGLSRLCGPLGSPFAAKTAIAVAICWLATLASSHPGHRASSRRRRWPARRHPADDLYEAGEARRQDRIARQLDTQLPDDLFRGLRPPISQSFRALAARSGRLWGYPGPRPITHPIGHQSVQTGPNQWVYRPLYSTDPRLTGPRPRRDSPMPGRSLRSKTKTCPSGAARKCNCQVPPTPSAQPPPPPRRVRPPGAPQVLIRQPPMNPTASGRNPHRKGVPQRAVRRSAQCPYFHHAGTEDATG